MQNNTMTEEKKQTILVAENYQDALDVHEALLERNGYNVIPEKNYARALQLVKEGKGIELVLIGGGSFLLIPALLN